MAFGYNRTTGSATQVVGDLVAGSDPQRDTKIDFGDNQINFVVSGATVASITPSQFSASLFIGNGSSLSNITGGSSGSGSNSTDSFVSSSTWTFNHNLNNRTPVIQVLDSNYNVIIPENISLTSSNTAIITFPTSESGYAIASLGGLGVSASYAATASSVQTLNQNVYATGNITGSILIATSNGAGTNFKVGDDAWIGDINTANTAQIMGQQNNSSAYIRFGSGASNPIIGSSGNDTLQVTGSINVSGSITMPNRPAFRVIGTGGGKSATTILSGSYLSVDYQQGSGWNNSTGTFTAPIAGLYQVNVVVRTNSNSLGTISQLIVYKNNTTITPSPDGTAQIMIEFAANTTMNHAGGSTISRLAVGDTLKMIVTVGQISFDGNDNFSIAYIG